MGWKGIWCSGMLYDLPRSSVPNPSVLYTVPYYSLVDPFVTRIRRERFPRLLLWSPLFIIKTQTRVVMNARFFLFPTSSL